MIQSMSLPLYSEALREYGDWADLQQEVHSLGCDGIEAIWGGEAVPEDLPVGLVQGYHLIFFHDWVDLWNGNWPALKDKYGSLERATAVYGGLGRETLLRQYRDDLERAKRLGAGYVVFHVSDVSMEECFTYRFSHTNDQVITAALELINELLPGKRWPFAFLVENQWWPGFTFTEPRQTERLLDGIRYANKGILLDTGHLMNCCTALRSQAEGAAYISSMLERHGSLCSMIRGVHFHQSLSGPYVQSHTGLLPEDWPEEFEQRFSINYAHVLQVDQHRPWTDSAILPVLDRLQPAWLTHELTSRTRAERARAVALQQALLQKRETPMTDTFVIQNLCFSYPEQSRAILQDMRLTVRRGEFLVLCGPSGCGKSTLLRQLKTVLAPHGRRSGTILFEGQPLDAMDQRQQTERIGFVQQSPDNQIVTDKVWHELAFGLESLGYETPVIRQRVAEMAAFFGIESWFYKNVTELSGGQKQLLNLASVMAMQPSVLVLDEPTSQLDPIAASDFLATLGRINRELGTTIILTEHRLEDAFPLATRVAVMESGRLLCSGTPAEVGAALRTSGHTMFLAMPTAMRVWAAVEQDGPCPVTVREGRDWLTAYGTEHPLGPLPPEPSRVYPEGPVLEASELWFKYEKDGLDVVRGLSHALKKGEFYALLGGNGAGKSTSLKLLAGLLKPHRGTVNCRGTIGVLPQNPQTLFVKKTVREDLAEILGGSKAGQAERIAHVVALCRLEGLLDRHPYDLSGGEQQRAALAKVLLLNPDILLMDEPTKGLDAEFKQVLAEILQVLLRRGVTILMVSHDIGFCARYAHRCALFFDGSTVAEGTPWAFFSGNSFYTTSANRMARELEPEAITPEDVIALCGGQLPPVPELPDDIPPLPEPEAGSTAEKPKKLPWWRKLLAALSAGIALILFCSFMGVTDLTALVTTDGLTSLAGEQLLLYFVFCISLLVFAVCITRRSHRPDYLRQTPKEQRKLAKRTLVAAILIVLLIPVTLFVGITYLGGKKYYFISLLILLETMLPFFLIFEGRKPQARELVIIAVLCAIGVAGRAFFFMLPQFKPVMAVTIIAGVAFGGETGFLVGAMTMLASNVMFGQGPLAPWQMFSMGIIGFLAGILFRKGLLMRTRGTLCSFGALCAILVYGGIMNGASALTANRELTGGVLLSYYITGIPFDCIHAIATWLFLWFAAEPMLEKLDRIKVKYGLAE